MSPFDGLHDARRRAGRTTRKPGGTYAEPHVRRASHTPCGACTADYPHQATSTSAGPLTRRHKRRTASTPGTRRTPRTASSPHAARAPDDKRTLAGPPTRRHARPTAHASDRTHAGRISDGKHIARTPNGPHNWRRLYPAARVPWPARAPGGTHIEHRARRGGTHTGRTHIRRRVYIGTGYTRRTARAPDSTHPWNGTQAGPHSRRAAGVGRQARRAYVDGAHAGRHRRRAPRGSNGAPARRRVRRTS